MKTRAEIRKEVEDKLFFTILGPRLQEDFLNWAERFRSSGFSAGINTVVSDNVEDN
jgi:hypothetical protein